MSSAPRCILPHLENPNLNGILIGLDRAADFKMKETTFNCCDGKGLRWDELRQCQVSCSIKSRYQQTQALLSQFQQYWPTQEFPHATSTLSAQILRDTADMIKGTKPQATLLTGLPQQPGSIWLYALALSWRYGMPVYLFSYLRRGQTFALPKSGPAKSSERLPSIILVEQWSRLSDAHERNQLEAMISYVYNANSFLCLELVTQKSEPRSAKSSESRHLAKYKAHIDRLKDKPPLKLLEEFLEPDSFSQIHSLCHLPRHIYNM